MNPDLKKIDLTRIFFLDIETVSAAPDFDSLDEDWKELWSEKTQWQRKDQFSAEAFYPIKAGIFAEFAKVVCVSIGFLSGQMVTPGNSGSGPFTAGTNANCSWNCNHC